MKISRYFISILALILVFAILAIAQTEKTQPVAPNKVALIYAIEFENENTGIKELAEIIKQLKEEFIPHTEKLKLMMKELQASKTELHNIGESYKLTGTMITKEFFDKKIRETEMLNAQFESKQAEMKSLYEQRKFELTEDVNKKIAEALKQYAKEKGYETILDISLVSKSLIVVNEEKTITKEFIGYYNFLSAKQQ